ncbi:MAG: sulfotransferase family 2 domain-containing protein [Bacteroidota bacterium]
MPHFKNREKDYIISTNFKVMYSTLRKSQGLKRLKEELIWLHRPRVNYVIGRNPYDRLESFYRDKLNKRVNTSWKWGRTHKIFFKPLGLSFFSSNQEKFNAFKELTFEKFIRLLPQAYMKNRHLHPQVKILKDLKNVHKLKLESEEDLQFMKNELGIDTGIRANQTDKKDFDLKWTREMYDVVNKLYSEDFDFFGYPKH